MSPSSPQATPQNSNNFHTLYYITPQTPVVAISPNLFILKTSFVQYTHTDVHEVAYHAVPNPLLHVTSITHKFIFPMSWSLYKQRHDIQQYNRDCAFSRGLDGRQISPKQTYHGDEGGSDCAQLCHRQRWAHFCKVWVILAKENRWAHRLVVAGFEQLDQMT